jgi:6-phosphogluconate dehydrogenase
MNEKYDFGMIGLGTMGSNLVLNMTDHGYSVAGYDRDTTKTEALLKQAVNKNIYGTALVSEFVDSLKQPRKILMLVPAGSAVDSVIDELIPMLAEKDLLMDCGNSNFKDTETRIDRLAEKGIRFMGIGVSGGDEGARHGPSIMPGGDVEMYKMAEPMLKAIAAKVNNEPCVTRTGNRSAGHYVKMVHNGIEYGLMQLLAEAYHLLKQAGLSNDEMHDVFSKWNNGQLHSFLTGITAEIFKKKDDRTNKMLLDMILDSAHQKGTGAWTSINAMELQVPIPVIDIAVSMREMSALKNERVAAEIIFSQQTKKNPVKKEQLTNMLEQTFHFALLITYAQGFALIHKASSTYGYDIRQSEIARIWRGGCIIRSALLDDIMAAFSEKEEVPNLIISPGIAKKLQMLQESARQITSSAIEAGIPVAAMMASLAYFDSYRNGWLPANLIQAQRDYFGAHTYERTDTKGIFHTQWHSKDQ